MPALLHVDEHQDTPLLIPGRATCSWKWLLVSNASTCRHEPHIITNDTWHERNAGKDHLLSFCTE